MYHLTNERRTCTTLSYRHLDIYCIYYILKAVRIKNAKKNPYKKEHKKSSKKKKHLFAKQFNGVKYNAFSFHINSLLLNKSCNYFFIFFFYYSIQTMFYPPETFWFFCFFLQVVCKEVCNDLQPVRIFKKIII